MNAATVIPLPRRLAPYVDGLPATFWYLWLGMLVNRVGSFIVPLLALYLTQARGQSLSAAGLIVSAYGLGSLAGTTVAGVLADRIGRRATLIGSLVSASAAMLLAGAARSTVELAAAIFLLGLTSDAFRPPAMALVADVVPPQHRMKAFSLQYWAINLGWAFAATVGGFVASHSFTVLFVGDAATTLAFAFIVWRKIPETRPKQAAGTKVPGSLLTPLLDGRFAAYLLFNLVWAALFFQHITVLPADMKSHGLGPEHFGLAIATNGVLIVLLQPTVSRWVEHRDKATLLGAAAALTGLGLGLTVFAGSLLGFAATVAVWTLGEIIAAPTNSTIVADLSPLHLRGRYQGAFGLSWSLAIVLGPAVGPPLADALGYDAVWVTCAVLGAALAVGHLTVTRRLLARAPPVPATVEAAGPEA